MNATATLTTAQSSMVCLIRSSAEQLWDVSETIDSTGYVSADDWETARLVASHLVAALAQPPAASTIAHLHAARHRATVTTVSQNGKP
jgi:hypothetical protein